MDHQNMSEHVLCMVLYLIELGLDNQVQDNKEDEVRYGLQPLSSLCRLLVSTSVLQYLMLPGALHWGALPRQLVPWHQPPVQSAPCHQLCEGPGPWDSPWSEERGPSQHQHWSVFLWPGKRFLSYRLSWITVSLITVQCHCNKNNWK